MFEYKRIFLIPYKMSDPNHASFIEFCRHLVTEDIEEVDIEAVLSFFTSYIEPYCEKHSIELPTEVIEYFSSLYEVMNEEEEEDDDEEDEDEDEEDEDEEDEDEDEDEAAKKT
jgi:hypothetical protein